MQYFNEDSLSEHIAFNDAIICSVAELVGALIIDSVAGRLIGKSPETLRRWCLAHGIGDFSPAGAVFLVSRKRLAAYLLQTTGQVPAALR